MCRVESAIQATATALRAGAHVSIMKLALVSDGFKPEKADIIIRWALQFRPADSKGES
jgi:hypothetical protein